MSIIAISKVSPETPNVAKWMILILTSSKVRLIGFIVKDKGAV